jgi:hypothetical protein
MRPGKRSPHARQVAGRRTQGREPKPSPTSYQQHSPREAAKTQTPTSRRPASVPQRDPLPRDRTVAAVTSLHSAAGYSLRLLAQLRKLDEGFLRRLGLDDAKWGGQPAVRVPFLNGSGCVIAARYITAPAGPDQFRWRSFDKPVLYGLNRLADARKKGWVLLTQDEGECWVAWHHELPAVAVPMLCQWDPRWAKALDGLEVYVWPTTDGTDLPRIAADLPEARVIGPPGGESLTAAHRNSRHIADLISGARANATPITVHGEKADGARIAQLEEQAHRVLAAKDPVSEVEAAIRSLGYGGEIRTAMVVYLAVTTRVLPLRRGNMLVHILMLGPPSAGKNYTYGTVLMLLPEDAYHQIDAGSPKVLIYDEADLRHRVVIFSEADSLPAGEDNPAASAVRNLLQDGRLHYQVVVKDPETGRFGVQEIDREGPTVLLTTSVQHLGAQLESRMLVLDVPDDARQINAALQAQANLEGAGPPSAPPGLVAFQAYLQALAPWDVVVPFAKALATALGKATSGSRVLRDYQKILSLVKGVTAIRHRHRERDDRGRLIATIRDYAAVFEYVGPVYESSVSGVSVGVRKTVAAVAELTNVSPVTATAVATAMSVNKMTVSRYVRIALEQTWLVNNSQNKQRFDLALGEPLPEREGLPEPRVLQSRNGVTPETGGSPDTEPMSVRGSERTGRPRQRFSMRPEFAEDWRRRRG